MTRPISEEAEEFHFPEHGIMCFHCGETFMTMDEAQQHFGFEPSADPACRIKLGGERGLLSALRKAEAELAYAWGIIHSEGSQVAISYQRMVQRHRDQLIAAEETGYSRGLRDAKRELN